MKAYISGPMTGLPGFNYAAFDATALWLRAWGFVVVNPAEVGRAVPDAGWDRYMELAARAIVDPSLDLVVTLDGWEKSRGARLEVALARRLGIPVRSFAELRRFLTGGEAPRARRRAVVAVVVVFVASVALLWPLAGTGAPVALAFWLLAGLGLGAAVVASRRRVGVSA